MTVAIELAERGLVPDPLARYGIRGLLRRRLQREERRSRPLADIVEELKRAPIAIEQDRANEQHYEVPPEFFALVMGRHMKYSACWWDDDTQDLDAAEAAMLELSCERAELADGQDILEIGCGWGSLTLFMAERYPNSRIRAVSNSAPQRRWIEAQARQRGLDNVVIDTADISRYQAPGRYDRIVSIECFEHCRNYHALFARLASWLHPQGSVFVHVFCHATHPYPFETDGDRDWMAKHFFSGGFMPSEQLFTHFDEHLMVERQWRVDGTHYERTSRAWLDRLDRHRDEALAVLRRDLSPAEARRQFHRWRLFFLACAECFGYQGGSEWFVGHYRLVPHPPVAT